MEKFSLFDFIAFVVPGGSTLILFYWTSTNATSFKKMPIDLPDTVLLTGILMLAFFLGLLLSYLGEKIESKSNKPKSWHEILVKNTILAEKLDTICHEIFGYHFRTVSANNEVEIDVSKSEQFYDSAYYILQLEGKIDKISALQSQYVFFRNSAALSFLSFFCCIFVGFSQLNGNIETRNFAFFLAILSIFCFLISQRMSFKRRHRKMSSTLNTFYAYHISHNYIKK
jgi:hypothetical protein